MNLKAIFLAALAAGSGYAGLAFAQQVFKPAENDFVIAFPTPPLVENQAPGGKDGMGSRYYAAEAGGETFALTIDRYPAHIHVPAPNKDIYQRLVWAHAHDPGMTFISDRPVMLSSLPGWEGVYRTQDGKIEVRRVLMLGDSIYQLIDVGPGSEAGTGGEAFFTSFKVTATSLSLSRNVVGPLT